MEKMKSLARMRELNERHAETFIANLDTAWRLTIPKPIRESLSLQRGDRLRVITWKDIDRPVKPVIEIAEEPAEEITEKEDEDSSFRLTPIEAELLGRAEVRLPDSAELLSKIEVQQSGSEELLGRFEAQATAEPVENFEQVLETVVTEPPVQDHKTPPQIPKGEQEYVDPCLHGLDFPLQDLEICIKCKLYLKKFSWAPIGCTWTGWQPIGWEENEKEPKEETENSEDFVMRSCKCSTEDVRHSKRKMSRGLVRYVCTQCKKGVTLYKPEKK